MKKTLLHNLLAGFILLAGAVNAQDKMIRVHGKVLSNKDSSAVNASILYEKLPYYDDMGMARTSLDGSFEFHLVEGTTYNIRIENIPNYEPFLQELNIVANEGNDGENIDFYVTRVEDEELITLENLVFSRGSATISPSSYPALNEFIEYINNRPEVNIQLEGHTDFAGNADANMRLSEARVQSVAEYLTSNGVKKARVTVKAFGGSQPLTMERTEEAKTRNRRVEVRLIRPKS